MGYLLMVKISRTSSRPYLTNKGIKKSPIITIEVQEAFTIRKSGGFGSSELNFLALSLTIAQVGMELTL